MVNRSPNRGAIVLVALAASQAVADAEFVASADNAPFCRRLLERLNAGEDPPEVIAHIGATRLAFAPGRIAFQTANAREITEEIHHAAFDVDNDGGDEILIKYGTSLRGEYGELLWVVRSDIKTLDFANTARFSHQEYARFEAIESIAPWPYKSRGLYLVEITPFSLDGKNYLGIEDTLFGNPSFPTRSWVIATFRGRKLGPGGFGHETDDFETICSFRLSR